MSIDNNLGMMLFSGDMSGAQSIGGLQGMANCMTDASGESAFQQLLTQMLAGNTATADGSGTSGTNAAPGKSDGTGDLLSSLLFTGGNTAKARLLNTVKTLGESMEQQGQTGESKSAKEAGSAMEMLQAMMAGLNGTVSPANMEKLLAEIENGTSPTKAVSAIGSVMAQSGKPEIAENKQTMNPSFQIEIPKEAAAAGEMKIMQSAAPVVKAAIPEKQTENKLSAPEVSITEKAFVPAASKELKELESLKSAAPERKTGTESKTSEPAEFLQQGIKAADAKDDKQAAATGIATKEAPADKPKLKSEAADDMDSNRMVSFQNSVQGAATLNGTAETNPQTQQVQAPEQYSQIREEILAKLEKNGPTEFKMQLEPKDLGQIDIKLKLSEGKLVIDILAANAKTQALLTSQVDKLISSMGLQNVQVESVQVSQQMNPQAQDNSQNQGFSMNSAMDFSQRRQQEQYQQQIYQNANLAGTFSLQQDETQADSNVNRIGTNRYDSHRMNYTV